MATSAITPSMDNMQKHRKACLSVMLSSVAAGGRHNKHWRCHNAPMHLHNVTSPSHFGAVTFGAVIATHSMLLSLHWIAPMASGMEELCGVLWCLQYLPCHPSIAGLFLVLILLLLLLCPNISAWVWQNYLHQLRVHVPQSIPIQFSIWLDLGYTWQGQEGQMPSCQAWKR